MGKLNLSYRMSRLFSGESGIVKSVIDDPSPIGCRDHNDKPRQLVTFVNPLGEELTKPAIVISAERGNLLGGHYHVPSFKRYQINDNYP